MLEIPPLLLLPIKLLLLLIGIFLWCALLWFLFLVLVGLAGFLLNWVTELTPTPKAK